MTTCITTKRTKRYNNKYHTKWTEVFSPSFLARSFIWFALSFLTPTLLGAQTLTFTRKAPRVGEVVTESKELTMNLNTTVKLSGEVIGSESVENQEIGKRSQEILKANKEKITKIKVTFLKKEESEKTGEATPKIKQSPVAGKTYIIEAGPEGNKTILYEDGKIPANKEMELLEEEFLYIGKEEDENEALINTPLEIGKPVKALEMKILEKMGMDLGEEASRIKVSTILTGKRKCGPFECAVFAISMKFSGKIENNVNISMNLKGEFLIILEGARPYAMNLQGPVLIEGEEMMKSEKMEIKGKGTMKARSRYEYK